MVLDKEVTNFEGNISNLEDLVDDEEERKESKDEEMKAESVHNHNYAPMEQTEADLLIGSKPQPPMMPNNILEPNDPSYRILCWNSIGSIALREEMNMNCVEIDFADKNFHKNLITDDDIKAELG
jgi:hypothetical protein